VAIVSVGSWTPPISQAYDRLTPQERSDLIRTQGHHGRKFNRPASSPPACAERPGPARTRESDDRQGEEGRNQAVIVRPDLAPADIDESSSSPLTRGFGTVEMGLP
jgi:hypothetical protein